jgi:TIR domain/NB-ARC domain
MTTVHGRAHAGGGGLAAGLPVVFVSYSRSDADWLPRFETMLRPVVDGRGMRVWSDTSIGAGRRWRPEIDDAIACADVALLLVSPDFLASDFIMRQELPALTARGVPLVPVLLRACRYRDVAQLCEVQWAHDPGREGPLAELKKRKVDGAIVRVTDALMEVLDDQAPRTEADAVPTAEAAHSSEANMPALVLTGAEGGLAGVPDPPIGFVQRDELDELRAVLLGAGDGAMAITGGQGLGLHGQGGIGKTVLAAALARDPLLRRHFPDGVYWVTLGERPDLVGAQLDLLERLGAPAAEVPYDARRRPSAARRPRRQTVPDRRRRRLERRCRASV